MPLPSNAVQHCRQDVGQHQHDGHHHDGLQHEGEPGKPQLDAVPPTQEPVHRPHPNRYSAPTPSPEQHCVKIGECCLRDRTTCLIVGGGPAGMMLGLLLARAGVKVTVMEKHADFLRDFRGDTVHASTLRLLDELGLGAVRPDSAPSDRHGPDADAGRTSGPRPDPITGRAQHIALVPQWDFLELLAAAAEVEPSFRLMRSTEVTGVMRDGNRIVGVTYRDQAEAVTGATVKQMRAELTVACDGRASTVRSAVGLTPRAFGAPMDVWWFRLPRQRDDPTGLAGMFGAGHGVILIDRGDYYQIAYIIPKGTDSELRSEGIEALRRVLVSMVPWLADRVDALNSFDDVKLLDVQLNRLRRWYCDGLLLHRRRCPCDVAGRRRRHQPGGRRRRRRRANLAGPLRAGRVSTRQLARVQVRRWVPTAILQAAQRMIHANVVAVAVGSENNGADRPPPRAVRTVASSPALRRFVGYMVAIGPLSEHAPAYASAR